MTKIKLSPTQELIVEALISRIRLGENFWNFERKFLPQLKDLADKGVVRFQSDSVENYFRVWLLESPVKEDFFSPTYMPPLLEDYISKTEVAEKYVLKSSIVDKAVSKEKKLKGKKLFKKDKKSKKGNKKKK